MAIRALRGAITVPENTREAILAATHELLDSLIESNGILPGEVISATFTATGDLDRAYPAEAAREKGWTEASLLCLQELEVAGSLARCLRVQVLWETDLPQAEMRHRYLRGAADLRPDRGG